MAAMAFSSAGRVMICRAVRFFRTSSMTISPARKATSSLRSSMAGTLAVPMGEIPRISKAVAMVLAVNCPPHAPGPGQAWLSRSSSSASVIFLAAWAPTPSNTSWMVTSRPWNRPGMMDPP